MRLLFAAALVSCAWPEHRFRSDDAAVVEDFGPPEDSNAFPPPSECPPEAERVNACDELRHFPGTWVVDGKGDEFCRSEMGKLATPVRRFSMKEAAKTTNAALPETVEVRAGLSPYGVHVFVKVLGDPRAIVDRDDLTKGDAIEIFVRGYHDRTLTGALDVDQAHHLVLTPPTATSEGLAARYLNGKRGAPLADERWQSRRVKGGWEVELHYSWADLDNNQPAVGMTIGFDIAIDIRDDAGSGRAIMHVQPVSASPCDALSITPADPRCDDRTWCLAKAYVP
jgi:hypothetical protein